MIQFLHLAKPTKTSSATSANHKMSDQKNLILAVVLSVAILMIWDFMYMSPEVDERPAPVTSSNPDGAKTPSDSSEAAGVSRFRPTPSSNGQQAIPSVLDEGNSTDAESPRINIEGNRLHGSMRLAGARIDDLKLTDYYETTDLDSPNVTMLAPSSDPKAYFAEFGWIPGEGTDISVPIDTSVWRPSGESLTTEKAITLEWDNGQGLIFQKIITIDENFLITVIQRVTNRGSKQVRLFPYGLIARSNPPDSLGFFILHEGPIGILKGEYQNPDYDDLPESESWQQDFTKNKAGFSKGGWLGFTDKYWLAALIPDQSTNIQGRFIEREKGAYQVDFLGGEYTIEVGDTVEVASSLFAGAKEVHLLDQYQKNQGFPKFELAVDWGYFYFLTKPIFFIIDYLYKYLGNFGMAIVVFTVLIRLLFYPLASKAFRSMHAMRRLQPEMVRLREQHSEDRQKLHQAMMEMYRNEKVNPMAGCLPIAMQIPVFFALYKVLFVTIEMRHKPFFGWIQDLSAPDPTNIFELFGLIPWDAPLYLQVGIWPLLMGISMFLQQKINPQPVDPMQAKIFLALPVVFTFVLAQFAAGLVVYWTWNNILSMAQQWLIYKRAGISAKSAPDGNSK